MFIDTHCHIQFQAYKDDREEVVRRVREKGLILNLVGTQKDTSRAAVELAERNDNLYASIGTHPIHLHSTHVDEEETSFNSREESFDDQFYDDLAKSPKVIGVGETGLDLFHIPHDIPADEVLAKQSEIFLAHMRFAIAHELPLVVHCRDAHDHMIELLVSKGSQRKAKGTIHCFTSDWTHAERYLDMGFYLGFTGVITFPPKKSEPEQQHALLDVIKRMPLDRVLVETDSPYLAPIPYRGKRAEPWMVEEVIKKIAEIKEVSFAVAEKQIEKNTRTLFQKMGQ